MGRENNFPGDNTVTNSFGRFIGKSKAMLDVYKLIEDVGPKEMPVFIKGPSGTGKEICAQAIHRCSDRDQAPFIVLNCAALPHHLIESALFGHVKGAFTGADQNRSGAIEQAESGTLFLDEICEMPIELQAKLLRFTQEYKYQKLGSDRVRKANVRLICATNRNLKNHIESGLFREDLYYRLHVVSIDMPPLSKRTGDILDIAHFYLMQYAKLDEKEIKGFSKNAEELIKNYHWPGNIRELQNIIRKIVATTNNTVISAAVLPEEIFKTFDDIENDNITEENSVHLPLWKIEKMAIEQTIAFCQGNIPKAAAILDISPSTIYRKKQSWKQK